MGGLLLFRAPAARVVGAKRGLSRHDASRVSELTPAEESSFDLDHMSQLWAAHCAVQVKTGSKTHAGPPKVGRGPALDIARGFYYFNDSFSRWTADHANAHQSSGGR